MVAKSKMNNERKRRFGDITTSAKSKGRTKNHNASSRQGIESLLHNLYPIKSTTRASLVTNYQ
eukprot:1349836-Pleurochrysis_carterae.AAC.10